MYQIKTARGYLLSEVVSALQKAVRRSDAKTAGYFAVEMFESNFVEYAWRRLLTISAEDCWGIVTHEIVALYDAFKIATQGKKGKGRIFLAKAVILLCLARKSRDADHLTNLVYDQKSLSEKEIENLLNAVRGERVEIPDYAFDCHTAKGKNAGKTKKDFFVDEFRALKPREPGLFDNLVTEVEAV